MSFRDLKNRLIELEQAIIHFRMIGNTRHKDIAAKAAVRPRKQDSHVITWQDIKPRDNLVDSWATRIGALAVTSGLLSLEDELEGSARSIVTLMAVTILVLSYEPVWRYSRMLYQHQKKTRTIRDSFRLVIPFMLTTIVALGALPIFSLSTQNLLNYMMSTDGKITIIVMFLLWVGVFLCVGEYRRLTQPRSVDETHNDNG